MRQKIITSLRFVNFEAVIWTSGLLYLALTNHAGENHFSICPIKNFGFSFCPGCGLGESISLIFKFEFVESFSVHPLGIPAFIILLHRIIHLTAKSFYNYRNYFSQQIGV